MNHQRKEATKMSYDEFVFWALIVLLCLVTLTTGREWWNVIRKAYRHAIEVWKSQPYLGYITGGGKSKKMKVPESEQGTRYEDEHKTIFPRSRRTT